MFMYFSRPYLTGFLSRQSLYQFLSVDERETHAFQWKCRGDVTVVESNMENNRINSYGKRSSLE